jgi:serine/threonine-protein kinase
MRPLAFLQCIAKAVVKRGARLLGLEEIVELVWDDWDQKRDEAERVAELQALVQMAAGEFRQQVEAIVREVAGPQPAEVQQRVSNCLRQVPDLLRQSFRRPEDPLGHSVPPGLRLQQASDLVPLLTSHPAEPNATQPLPAGPHVTLHFSVGPQAGETLVCTEPTVLLFGRASDCKPQCPEKGYNTVSRHHCLVEINPPDVRVRDLGSRNGTFVSGHLIGKRPAGADPNPEFASPEHDLGDGSQVSLTEKGPIAFSVRVHLPAYCAVCEAIVPEEQKTMSLLPPSGYLCPNCRGKDREAAAVVKTCIWCHKEVAAERGANRPGMFVCGGCRANVQAIMQDLATRAHTGAAELRALCGYTLLEELGHGGMGAVYRARHERTGEPAAIKLMLPRVAADECTVALFQREIRNTMALQHRHVVRCLDHGYARGTFFLALEYCEGGSVERLLARRGGTLPVDEAVEITLQALEGLEHAHQADIPFVRQKGGGYDLGKGLVHRDLKPANLVLTGWGSGRLVKIADYGLAKAFDETGLSGGTRTGELAGTWKFMCRQQVVDYKRSGPEVDVWALAASLYNLLTGHVPRHFPADKDPWLVVLESDPVPIRRRNAAIPPRLAEVIDHALVEEPEIPFRSASELKQALEQGS